MSTHCPAEPGTELRQVSLPDASGTSQTSPSFCEMSCLKCHSGKPEGQSGHGTACLWHAVRYFRWVKTTFWGAGTGAAQAAQVQLCPRACPGSQVQPAASQLCTCVDSTAGIQPAAAWKLHQQSSTRLKQRWHEHGRAAHGHVVNPAGWKRSCAGKWPNGRVPHWTTPKIWALLF